MSESDLVTYERNGRIVVRDGVMPAEGTNVIEFHYCSLTGTSGQETGSQASIGLENLAGTTGLQHSFNTAGSISTANGLRYTP